MNQLIVKLSFIIIGLLLISYIFIYNTIEYENFFEHLSAASNSGVQVFDANTWIFNQRVAQYSTKIVLDNRGDVIIEALAFFSYENEISDLIKSKVRCIALVGKRVHVLRILDSTSIVTLIPSGSIFSRLLWKIRCELKSTMYDASDNLREIRIALTDVEEYQNLKNTHKFDGQENYLVSFHHATFHDLKVPKKRAVAHCVHMVRGLDETRTRRMRNWLFIQKSIGIDRVRLYFASVNKSVENALRDEFRDFIEVVNYGLEFGSVCRSALSIVNSSQVEQEISEYMYENCLKFYRVYFDDSKSFMINAHEKICTNDCLMNFQYQYEFATNYDFDEFIFPRKFRTDDFGLFKSAATCNQSMSSFKFDYSIYNYARDLVNEHGSDVSFFLFENVVFLTIPESLNFIDNFINLPSQNIQLAAASGEKLILRVTKSDFDKISEIIELQDMIKCFNATIVNSGKFESIWNVPFALLINNRWGKSLFNTNLTVTYHQHGADLERGTRKVRLPIEKGFVNHFREHFGGFLENQVYSFYHFRLDLEYYQFLAHLNSILNSNKTTH